MRAATIMQEGGELIFPAIDRSKAGDLDPGSEFNVVNRVVAVVNGEPGVVGRAVRAELERLLPNSGKVSWSTKSKAPCTPKLRRWLKC